MKIVVDKRQKFNIGRTINVLECVDCSSNIGECGYLTCKNYCPKLKQVSDSVDEFVAKHKDVLEKTKYRINSVFLVNAFFDSFVFGLGNGLYWDYSGSSIRIQKMVRGEPETSDVIDLLYSYGKVVESNKFSSQKSKLVADRISKKLLEIAERKGGAE